MDTRCKNWVEYWSKDSFWRDSLIWEINSKLFFNYLKRIISALDIGCGYTELFLGSLVKSVLAVDVAEQFVDICSKRCKNYSNISTGYLRKDDYTNLEGFKGSFSIILCVSVSNTIKTKLK